MAEPTDLRRLALRPEDVVILRLNFSPSAEQVARLQAQLAEQLAKAGHRNEIVVLGPGVGIDIVGPPPPSELGDPVALSACPPGLFVRNGHVCFLGEIVSDAFDITTGERLSLDTDVALEVQPLTVDFTTLIEGAAR